MDRLKALVPGWDPSTETNTRVLNSSSCRLIGPCMPISWDRISTHDHHFFGKWNEDEDEFDHLVLIMDSVLYLAIFRRELLLFEKLAQTFKKWKVSSRDISHQFWTTFHDLSPQTSIWRMVTALIFVLDVEYSVEYTTECLLYAPCYQSS